MSETIATDKSPEELASQVVSFFAHVFLALFTVAVIFGALYLSGAESVPSLLVAALSFFIPMAVAFAIHMKLLRSAAPSIWIAGCVWLLIVGVHVLQMPTGPGQCQYCGPVQKIWLTLFDPFHDSNLMQGQGRLLGTWPALAMFGYALGAHLATRRRSVY